MIYKVIEDILLELNGEEVEIPVDSVLYKIPSDHLEKDYNSDTYTWNGITIKLEKNHYAIKKVNY